MSVTFRTFFTYGLLFYMTTTARTEHLAVYMKGGRVHVSYDRDGDTRNLQDTQDLSGDSWHTVSLYASTMAGHIVFVPTMYPYQCRNFLILYRVQATWYIPLLIFILNFCNVLALFIHHPLSILFTLCQFPHTVILALVYLSLSLFCRFHSLHTTCHAS